MVNLLLNSNKKLSVTSANAIYKGERDFETIRIVSAEVISGHKLSDCTVELHIINMNGDGEALPLDFDEELKADVVIGGKHTSVSGDLGVYLKITEGDSVGLTNEVALEVRPHRKTVNTDDTAGNDEKSSLTAGEAVQILDGTADGAVTGVTKEAK